MIDQLTKDSYDRLAADIYAEVMADFVDELQHNPGKFETVVFHGIYASALLSAAAVLAVDIGMSAEQFMDIARESYASAHAKAPRFG